MGYCNRVKRFLSLLAVSLSLAALPAAPATAGPPFIGMGDSIGEGVQGADAAWQTQGYSYLNLLSLQLQRFFFQPYISTGLFGLVGNPDDRSRIYPNQVSTNVAVSGATTRSLLYQRANAATTADISNELELVMYPVQMTQMEFVEFVPAELIVCWIGNNDVLSAATAFGNMNASQLTPVADFERDYIELVDRLGALVTNHGSNVVFANIPDVTSIGFLVDRATAESFTGFPVPLPDGHFTSILGVFLMLLEGNAALVGDPNFVLDAGEVAAIRARTDVFNAIIQREADRIGMPVVDINARFKEFVDNPPVIAGVTLRNRFLGGLFSLDGVHPSNIGHGLITNEFIRTMNQEFNIAIPELSSELLDYLVLTDPSIDKDGDGRASGRLGVGLLETLAFLAGITGDGNDFRAD